MGISLRKAIREDCPLIHTMQREAFASLLEKYHDYEMSPGNEPIEKIYRRFDQKTTDYYLILNDTCVVGAIRIIRLEHEQVYRISPIFVLPACQGRGIAQTVFKIIEAMYTEYSIWKLDTILQEKGNCYVYEKMGYIKTGEETVINEKMTIVNYKKVVMDKNEREYFGIGIGIEKN